MTGEFDAMDYVRELEAAGVPHVQAVIHAKAMAAAFNGVIRGELNSFGQRMSGLVAELKEEMIETEIRLQGQIVDTETRLQGQIKEVETRLHGQIVAAEKRMDGRIDELRKEINERFAKLEAKIDALEKSLGSLELKVETISKELVMMRWMMGAMLTLQFGMLARMLSV